MFLRVVQIHNQHAHEIELNSDHIVYMRDSPKPLTFVHMVDGQWVEDTGPATTVFLSSGETIHLNGTKEEILQRLP